MSQFLKQAIKEMGNELDSAGYTIKYKEPEHANGAFSVNLDGESYVGTVCFWPESLFEFQFNSYSTGDVAVLETHDFHSSVALKNYLKELIFNRLV